MIYHINSMDFLYLPVIGAFNLCCFIMNSVYWMFSTTLLIMFTLITEVLVPLIQLVFMTFTYLVGFILIAVSLLMGVALKSVPTENSFQQWVQQFVKLNVPENKEPVTGWFATTRNRLTTSINHTLVFYTIMSNFTIQFLFFGFMRIAVCTEKSDAKQRYVFVGIFNTWIPTPF
jgi:hypothetical protein